MELFRETGVQLGIAIAQAAIGHCKFQNNQFNKARFSWESALKRFKDLNHIFGIHYLNRWLMTVKKKMPKYKKDIKTHKEEARNILKNRV